MSMSYWGIIGYGVCIDDLDKYLDQEKVKYYVKKTLKLNSLDEDIFEDNTFYGDPFTNFAEFLCDLDDDKIFTWEDNGYSECYFLYEPQYPWRTRTNEPKDEDEVKEKMVKILSRVYNAPAEVLKKKIKYISTVGMG